MDIIITVVAFLFLVGLVITIHEGGHFLVGKYCGMKMLEFSIGFGPKIFERTFGKDQTKFTLRLLPLGGFVKPLDSSAVTPEQWQALSEIEKSRSFTSSAKWKKFLMVAAGPISNFILAFIVFVIAMSFVGTKVSPATIGEIVHTGLFAQTTLKPGDVIKTINGKNITNMSEAFPLFVNSLINGERVKFTTQKDTYNIDFSNTDIKEMSDMGKLMGFYFTGTTGDVIMKKVVSNSVAEKAGLKDGDILKKINGEKINDTNKTIRTIQVSPNKPLTFLIKRGGELKNINVIPELKKEEGKNLGKIGVNFELINENNVVLHRYGIVEGIEKSFNRVVDSSYTTVISIKRLLIGQLSAKTISGPIAIADYSGKSAIRGLYYYLMMIASISIAIGVFNLLPVPTLDGGHLAQYIIETVIRRDIPMKILNYFQYAGFGMLIGLFCFSLVNDLIKYII